MTLADLKPHQIATVKEIITGKHGDGLTNRLQSLGFITGKKVKLLRRFWFGGLLHVQVGITTAIALRPSEANLIIINNEC